MEKKCFKGLISLLFLAISMAFSPGLSAQKTVTGKVTDMDGSGLPGVSVVVKGIVQGTITDINGDYTLTMPEGADKLLYSYIGMITQEVEVGNQVTINVVMKPDLIGVDEIVVVGYGTRMKEELTGAVSTVSAEKLNATAETDVASRLQGQIAGVSVTTSNRPGAYNSTVRIRGVGTINDPNPLYIIDGVPADPSNNISPGDIESISVLKDASSAAIYGTRGANGVIIITTKHGRINQQPSINLSVRTGLSHASNQYDLLNTTEYAEAVWLSFANRGVAPSHAQYGSGSTPVIPDYILPAGAKLGEVDESTYSYPNNVIFKANKQGTNWYDEIYQNALVQEYDLSVNGGGENSTYAFSTNYLNEEGILKWTDFKRYTMRMNSDAHYKKWLKVGESVQISYIDERGNFSDNGEGTVVSFAYRSQPIIPVYDVGGDFAGSKAPEMGNSSNPVRILYDARNDNGRWMRILGNAFAEITLMQGLVAKTLFGTNWSQGNTKTYTLPTYEHSEPNTVNGVDYNTTNTLQWNWSNTLNYNKTFNVDHKLNVMVGTEAVEYINVWANGSRRVYFSEDPNYMQLGSGESNKENNGNASEWSLFSIFGRLNYDYLGKYFLETTLRRDGSSRFSTKNKYATFPAASAAWAISAGKFYGGFTQLARPFKIGVGWGSFGERPNRKLQLLFNLFYRFLSRFLCHRWFKYKCCIWIQTSYAWQ